MSAAPGLRGLGRTGREWAGRVSVGKEPDEERVGSFKVHMFEPAGITCSCPWFKFKDHFPISIWVYLYMERLM